MGVKFVTTEQRKARLLDLVTSVLEMARDGKRDYDALIEVLQIIKNDPDFQRRLGLWMVGIPNDQGTSKSVWGEHYSEDFENIQPAERTVRVNGKKTILRAGYVVPIRNGRSVIVKAARRIRGVLSFGCAWVGDADRIISWVPLSSLDNRQQE
jgi:hypothetical protein